MIVFYFYLIFALSTGVTAYFTLHAPTLKILKEEGYEIEYPIHPFISALVMMSTTALLAPIMIKNVLRGVTQEYLDDIIAMLEDDEDE